jgi:hypothetical protein
MNNKLSYIETADKKYPIVFNINVMEEIQEAYGSIGAWGAIVENADGGEPKVKDLKIGLMMMINEGIDIENEENGKNRPFVTAKQVGRIIGEVGFGAITDVIQNLTIASTNAGDNEGKNE